MSSRVIIRLFAGLFALGMSTTLPMSKAAANTAITPANVNPAVATEAAPQLAANTSPLTLVRNINHGPSVNALAFSRDGLWLATASGDSKLRVWNVNALLEGDERNYMRVVINLPAADTYATSLAFSEDGQWLMTGTYNGDFRRWDLNACNARQNTCNYNLLQEKDYRAVETHVSFDPTGILLAGANFDGTVTVWNWSDRTVQGVLEPETGSHGGDRLDGRFSSLAFSHDGRYLAAGSHNRSITFWDFDDSFRRVLTLETTFGIETIAFSPNSEILASGNLEGVELTALSYRRDRPEASDPILLENPSRVTSLVFSPDGRHILAGDSNGTLSVWDVEAESLVGRSEANQNHTKGILAVTHNAMNGLYATASTDGIVKLWRLP
ncbi:MAG: WD40 repeat domain-containing protein [Cyanobacteria bacterium J06626_26]